MMNYLPNGPLSGRVKDWNTVKKSPTKQGQR